MKNEKENNLVEKEAVAVALRVLVDEYFEGKTEDAQDGFVIRDEKYGNFLIKVSRV